MLFNTYCNKMRKHNSLSNVVRKSIKSKQLMHKNMQDRWEDENLLMQLSVLTYCISSRKGFLDLCASLKMAHFLPILRKLFASGRKNLHLGEPLMQEAMQNTVLRMPKNINLYTVKTLYRNACQRIKCGKSLIFELSEFHS